jgi:hypothetical protein
MRMETLAAKKAAVTGPHHEPMEVPSGPETGPLGEYLVHR